MMALDKRRFERRYEEAEAASQKHQVRIARLEAQMERLQHHLVEARRDLVIKDASTSWAQELVNYILEEHSDIIDEWVDFKTVSQKINRRLDRG